MSDEQVQTFEEVTNAFYPDAETEPLEVPTEEAEADETPTEEVEETEVEESDGDEPEETDEVEDAQLIEIDGVEHNLTDIQEWKQASDNVKLMQADCTKKWQEASDLKKSAETEMSKAQDLALELEALIAEDEEHDLKELKEYDIDKYVEVTERLAKRKAKVEELKASKPQETSKLNPDELAAESTDFYSYDPKWIGEDNQLSPKFQEDMKVASEYLKKRGYSQDEVNNVTRSHHWKTIVDASRFDAMQNKESAVKKKILKTPKATKPKAQTSTLSPEEIFYGTK